MVAHPLVCAGHEVAIANSRGPDTLVADLGASACAAATVDEAAAFGDAVLLAIALHAVFGLSEQAFKRKALIDDNNYYSGRDGDIATHDWLHSPAPFTTISISSWR